MHKGDVFFVHCRTIHSNEETNLADICRNDRSLKLPPYMTILTKLSNRKRQQHSIGPKLYASFSLSISLRTLKLILFLDKLSITGLLRYSLLALLVDMMLLVPLF